MVISIAMLNYRRVSTTDCCRITFEDPCYHVLIESSNWPNITNTCLVEVFGSSHHPSICSEKKTTTSTSTLLVTIALFHFTSVGHITSSFPAKKSYVSGESKLCRWFFYMAHWYTKKAGDMVRFFLPRMSSMKFFFEQMDQFACVCTYVCPYVCI